MQNKTHQKSLTIITQQSLEDWLDRQAAAHVLVAPREEAGVLLYRPVSGSGDISWKSLMTSESIPARKPSLSLKELFFPPTEQLFTIQKTGSDIILQETLPTEKMLVFGARPCDGRGVRILDALFLEDEPPDAYYQQRRENTTLIGLACAGMGPNCFCTSIGSAPDDPGGMDIMLTQTSDGYNAEAVTHKGRQILSEAGWGETVSGGEKKLPEKEFQLPGKEAWKSRFKDEIWERLGERCLSCRLCTYVCPTCRCFIIKDESLPAGGNERIRCWDACTGANYRRLAGGHRSRIESGERIRNRILCKFDYYPLQYRLGSNPACTGCGRCIDICPAGVDILEVLADMGAKT